MEKRNSLIGIRGIEESVKGVENMRIPKVHHEVVYEKCCPSKKKYKL